MGQYKVPQDVEADDKLLGPFSFRQFIYLLILAGLIAVAFALAKIFIFLAIIPLPFILLFAALALPIKKDQPMETYLVAIISYYLKPRNRFWIPGQKETTIKIIAPKITERPRARDITSVEANTRLSFLANLIDTGGQSIHANNPTNLNQQFLAEASLAFDMMDTGSTMQVTRLLDEKEQQQRADVINKMRATINSAENTNSQNPDTPPQIINHQPFQVPSSPQSPPTPPPPTIPKIDPTTIKTAKLKNLANNSDISVQTIQNQANNIEKNLTNAKEGEVFISLHD